jgi:hypothetical protein
MQISIYLLSVLTSFTIHSQNVKLQKANDNYEKKLSPQTLSIRTLQWMIQL